MSNNLGLIIEIMVYVATVACMVGVMQQKTKTNSEKITEVKTDCEKQITEIKADCMKEISELKEDFKKDIEEVKADAKEHSIILQSINNNLADLNTKFSLMLNGQLLIKGKE